jgi:hypothetical protein
MELYKSFYEKMREHDTLQLRISQVRQDIEKIVQKIEQEKSAKSSDEE